MTPRRTRASDPRGGAAAGSNASVGTMSDYRTRRVPAKIGRRLMAVFHLESPPNSLGELVDALGVVLAEDQGVDPARLCCSGPSRHEVRLDGEVVHTHCVLDALILPLLFGQRAEVRSETPNGGAVEITIGPEGMACEAREAVVSLGASRTGRGEVFEVLCPYINVFPSTADYERWVAETPEALTMPLSLADAAGLARDLAARAGRNGAPLEADEQRRSSLRTKP